MINLLISLIKLYSTNC